MLNNITSAAKFQSTWPLTCFFSPYPDPYHHRVSSHKLSGPDKILHLLKEITVGLYPAYTLLIFKYLSLKVKSQPTGAMDLSHHFSGRGQK